MTGVRELEIIGVYIAAITIMWKNIRFEFLIVCPEMDGNELNITGS